MSICLDKHGGFDRTKLRLVSQELTYKCHLFYGRISGFTEYVA